MLRCGNRMTDRDHYQEQLDTRAIELARSSLSRVEALERIVSGQFAIIDHKLDKLFDRFWLAALGVIGVLLLALGVYVANTVKTVDRIAAPVVNGQTEKTR